LWCCCVLILRFEMNTKDKTIDKSHEVSCGNVCVHGVRVFLGIFADSTPAQPIVSLKFFELRNAERWLR
jgi:hypothetical protein